MLKCIALCVPFVLTGKIEATGEATSTTSRGYTLAMARLDCADDLRVQCHDGQRVPSIEYQEPACDEDTDTDTNEREWECTIWCYGWCEDE